MKHDCIDTIKTHGAWREQGIAGHQPVCQIGLMEQRQRLGELVFALALGFVKHRILAA